MNRNEYWRHIYRTRRYCELLTKEELDARISEIMTNLLQLTPEAKIGLTSFKEDGGIWMELFTHLLEEMVLRYGSYPSGFTKDIFQKTPLPDFTCELARKASNVLKAHDLKEGQFFIKYGSSSNMMRLIDEGNLRIQSASYYKSSEHNNAVRDDETSLEMSLHLMREDVAKFVQNPEDVPDTIPNQRFNISHIYERDFWLYCVTESLESRLFVDFNALACVIITDRSEFIKRITSTMSDCKSGIESRHDTAQYVDPLLPKKALIDVPLSKHFKYSYQKEYRFIWGWEQNTLAESLGHVDLNIGSLRDIGVLVKL